MQSIWTAPPSGVASSHRIRGALKFPQLTVHKLAFTQKLSRLYSLVQSLCPSIKAEYRSDDDTPLSWPLCRFVNAFSNAPDCPRSWTVRQNRPSISQYHPDIVCPLWSQAAHGAADPFVMAALSASRFSLGGSILIPSSGEPHASDNRNGTTIQ